MPKFNKDNSHFLDNEKLIFGTEPDNQSVMYHDGASLVFENITISGAQGPQGIPGSGVPGNYLENESGSAGLIVEGLDRIDMYQGFTNKLRITDGTVAVGEAPSFYNNWGSLMVKSTGVYNQTNNGLKMAQFGESGCSTIDFLRSPTSATDSPEGTSTGHHIGQITWGTWNYAGDNTFENYARILVKDYYGVPATDTHEMSIQFDTRDNLGVWQTNFKINPGEGGSVSFSYGNPVVGMARNYTELDTFGTSAENTLMSAYGISEELINFRSEINALLATTSGSEYYEIFDSTISGARVDATNDGGYNPEVVISIEGVEKSSWDATGWHMGGNAIGVDRINDDPNLEDWDTYSDSLPTTRAVKQFIIENAYSGDGSNRLINTNLDSFSLSETGLDATWTNYPMAFRMKYTSEATTSTSNAIAAGANIGLFSASGPRKGTRVLIGDRDFENIPIINNVPDFGQSGPTGWNKRMQVLQKHNLVVADHGGTSVAIMGWQNSSNNIDYKDYIERRGPQLAFIKFNGTPEVPTYVGANQLIGRIGFDYLAKNSCKAVERGAFIEARTGTEYAYPISEWQIDGGQNPVRDDWSYAENSLYIGASPYVGMGKIVLRGKLSFDYDSATGAYVSGIQQDEGSDVYVPSQHGTDHMIPTVKYMLSTISDKLGMDSTATPIISRISNDNEAGYNVRTGHYASISSAGFSIKTGYNPGDLIFAVAGDPGGQYDSLGAFTWGVRLISRANQSKFFMENYATKAGYHSTIWTNYFTFFRAFGGGGMSEVKREGAALWPGLLESNNGAISNGTTIGVIQAIGQARASGIDRDPCSYWSAYQAGAKISFIATNVTNNDVHASIYFDTGSANYYGSYRSDTAMFDHNGKCHFGTRLFTRGYAWERAGQKGWVNIARGGTPNSANSNNPQGSLSLWATYPSIVFTANEDAPMDRWEGSSMNYNDHIDSRILQAKKTIGTRIVGDGLEFWMWDLTNAVEKIGLKITQERQLIVGEVGSLTPAGTLVVIPKSNTPHTGIALMSANKIDKINIHYDVDNNAAINSGDEGQYPLRLNNNAGAVYIGYPGGNSPTGGKLIVNGNITPSSDNTWNLGLPSYRWDDVWATNGTVQVSDEREKNDITKETYGLKFINKLKPVSFKRTGGIRKHHGLIAQDLEKVLKEMGKPTRDFAGLIHDEKADVYGIRYEEMIGPMLKAIQEMSSEIEALKAKLEV